MVSSLFVTGASGYVGQRVVRRALTEPGRRVVALVRQPDSLPDDLRTTAGLELVVGDLLSPAGWGAALEKCDAVIHLAALTGKARRAQHFRVNAEGTAALVEAASRVGPRLVHVSTVAVKFRDRPRYPYAESKEHAEQTVAASGLGHVIVRPTMVFGPAAPVLDGLARLASLPVMPVFGRGAVAVQPIWVDDLAGVLVDLALDGPQQQVIDVGGPERLPIEELMTRIRSTWYGKAARSLHVPLRPLRGMLGLLEPLLLPLLPLTAGQLASFANDGTAEDSAFMKMRMAGMMRLDSMLAEARPGG